MAKNSNLVLPEGVREILDRDDETWTEQDLFVLSEYYTGIAERFVKKPTEDELRKELAKMMVEDLAE